MMLEAEQAGVAGIILYDLDEKIGCVFIAIYYEH